MERLTRNRGALLLAVLLGILCLFGLRLYDLQIVKTNGNTNNIKTFTTETVVKAARGDILDRNGNVLVTNRASYDLVFNHYVIRSATGTNNHLLRLVQLCREMDIDYIDHFPISATKPFVDTRGEYNTAWQNYYHAYLQKVGGLDSDIAAPLVVQKLRDFYDLPEEWSDEDARAVIGLRYELALRSELTTLPNFVFLEDASSQELAALLELGIPGLKAEASTVREYNTKYAAHVLGYVGPITPTQWEQIYKNTPGYSMDALVGQSGLEQAFESYLHGTDGIRVDVVTVDGAIIDSYYKVVNGVEQRPVAGKNVELSIDLSLQSTAEKALEKLITQLRASGDNLPEGEEMPDGADAEGGSVVVMDVKTGQILACASYPTFDLSTYREDYNKLMETEYAPLFNRALQAIYPPGSTYKMIMAIAGIDQGIIDGETLIKDEGQYLKYIDSGYAPKCLLWTTDHYTHGLINISQALSSSCNYFFYELADNMGLSIAEIDMVAKGMGLGEKTGAELFNHIVGTRANEQTKAQLHKGDQSGWYPADQLTASIGQSDNKFTPLQLCVYTATLANQGTRYNATFLNRVLNSDYSNVEYQYKPQIVSQFHISDEAFEAVLKGMRMAVTQGTAYKIFGYNYPLDIAAKTGTAEHDAGGSDNGAFVCFAPASAPEIAIVVYGEKAGHGSTMGQIAKEILENYFHTEIGGSPSSGENVIN